MTALPPQLRALAKMAEWCRRSSDGEVVAGGIALEDWIVSGASGSLDKRLGIAPGPGQHSAATAIAHAERDRLLRQLADQFYPDLRPSPAGDAIALAWSRYASVAWIRERALEECPARHHGTEREFFWRMLKLRDYPLTGRAIRAILAKS